MAIAGSTKINGTEDVAKLMGKRKNCLKNIPYIFPITFQQKGFCEKLMLFIRYVFFVMFVPQGELFDDNNGACETPALELGFLVAESYNEPPTGKERTFRKALKLVKETAQKIKISDSGTHVGLVVYGKKPYMVFDFNEYFDMRSLSRAIEEVKTPAQGSRVGEALTFTKEQLYDKSARPGIPRALIVLSSKKSEDRIEHGVNTLKKAGVKIYTVGIGTEGDSMETSGMASDVPDTFYVDQDHLKTSVTKLVAKLCEGEKVR